MNFEEILDKILEIAQYPQEKRNEFITTFYEFLYLKLVSEIREIDPENADRVMAANAKGAGPDEMKKVFEEISKEPNVAEVVERVSQEVIETFVDDIAKNATQEQKKQILEVISPMLGEVSPKDLLPQDSR